MKRIGVFAVVAAGVMGMMWGAGYSRAQAGSPLTVRIVARSSETGSGGRIDVRPGDHFYVVVTNTSKEPIRLWRKGNSWGDVTLSFEFRGPDGKAVSVPRRGHAYTINGPGWTTLSPGGHMVFEIDLASGEWVNPPLPAADQSSHVEIKAIFAIPEEAEARKAKVWTGGVESPVETYTIWKWRAAAEGE